MCLYPKLVLNPKYKPNKKNGWNPPPLTDERIKYVPIGCQECLECRRQKANHWAIRLMEENKKTVRGLFVTLTFSNEAYKKLADKINEGRAEPLTGYQLDNEIATRAIDLFLENWRKQKGEILKHWFITELGHQGTENVHIHGIVWTNEPISEIRHFWRKNGWIYPRSKYEESKNYVNDKTIRYVTKYVTKIDKLHKGFKGKILCSKGIGKNYTENPISKSTHQFKDNGETNQTYRTRTGLKIGLPIYYRNKTWTEKQREQLWLQTIDKQTRYVRGTAIDVSTPQGEEEYRQALKYAQEFNESLGYNRPQTWEEEQYERERRLLKQKERFENTTKTKRAKTN